MRPSTWKAKPLTGRHCDAFVNGEYGYCQNPATETVYITEFGWFIVVCDGHAQRMAYDGRVYREEADASQFQ